jgi:hypothetical protein
MASTVLDIGLGSRAAHRARRGATASPPPAAPGLASGLTSRIHFWRGTSGRRHLFSVYSLLDCPPLPPAVYLLVRREADGRREILATGHVDAVHAPSNLATLRQLGAQAEANEVHVCLAADDADLRARIAEDLAPLAMDSTVLN